MNLDRIISVQNSITVFRDGDRCLKVFNEDCAKADVINEALNQARMEETTVTVPKILEVTEVNGKWAIVSEYIKGENLEQLMERYPEKAGEYMELFASLHCHIHQQSCPMFKKLKDELQRNINSSELSATDRYDLYSRWSGSQKITRPATATLCRPRSSSAPRQENHISLIGSMPRRAMPPQMPR